MSELFSDDAHRQSSARRAKRGQPRRGTTSSQMAGQCVVKRCGAAAKDATHSSEQNQ